MYFIQAIQETTWAANIITGGVLIGVFYALLQWFLKRFIAENDKKIKVAEDLAKEAKNKAHEIERNYIKRFEALHVKIEENERNTVNRVSKEISDVRTENSNYQIAQARWMGSIESKVDDLRNYFTNNKN